MNDYRCEHCGRWLSMDKDEIWRCLPCEKFHEGIKRIAKELSKK